MLGWIATHPAEAIELGEAGDVDLVETLLGLINRDWDYVYWEDVAITIGAFDSPRVTEFFFDLLATATDSAQAIDAASALGHRLGAEGSEDASVRERLIVLLTKDGPEERQIAIAELLVSAAELPGPVAVRVAVLAPEREAPPLAGQPDAWLAELAGPFGHAARERLVEQGTAALRELAGSWERLAPADRAWLLSWVSADAPGDPIAAELVARALAEGPDDLAPAALAAALRLPAGAVAAESLARWAAHPDAELRGAAIAAGAPADLESIVADEDAEPPELVAAMRRLAGSGGEAATGLVVRRLVSDEIDVRTAAREAAVAFGSAAILDLRPLVHHDSPETRAAAVRALLDLGDDDWLAAELL